MSCIVINDKFISMQNQYDFINGMENRESVSRFGTYRLITFCLS